MKLALDAMGGDQAPLAMVQGAFDYARANPQHTILLVGQEDRVRLAMRDAAGSAGIPSNVVIEHAPEVIGMAEKLKALKERPNDSMNVSCRLVKEGKADAAILCGNTACSVTAAQLHWRRIPGVKRAGILTSLPKPSGHTWVIDCGANAEGKADHLVQFAAMASIYVETTLKKSKPGVGVLSIGEEEGKGNDLTTATLALLKNTDLHVLGLVEGHDIYRRDDLDVVVCDGFTGNIVLKTSEGVEAALRQVIKEEITRTTLGKVGGALVKSAFQRVKERVDWRYVGGGLLLGVDGICIIGHGRSDPLAVSSTLRQAAGCVDAKLMQHLRARFKEAPAAPESDAVPQAG
jgi:phosphate acyltransferase